MFYSISWGSYWMTLMVLAILYYLYVLLVYYGDQKPRSRAAIAPTNNEELIPIAIQSLSNEMIAYLDGASPGKAGKQEILFSLRQIAGKYEVKDGSHQQAVSRLIQSACRNKCAVHLSEEEIRQVWMV